MLKTLEDFDHTKPVYHKDYFNVALEFFLKDDDFQKNRQLIGEGAEFAYFHLNGFIDLLRQFIKTDKYEGIVSLDGDLVFALIRFLETNDHEGVHIICRGIFFNINTNDAKKNISTLACNRFIETGDSEGMKRYLIVFSNRVVNDLIF